MAEPRLRLEMEPRGGSDWRRPEVEVVDGARLSCPPALLLCGGLTHSLTHFLRRLDGRRKLWSEGA